jgi:hypothetical protein
MVKSAGALGKELVTLKARERAKEKIKARNMEELDRFHNFCLSGLVPKPKNHWMGYFCILWFLRCPECNSKVSIKHYSNRVSLEYYDIRCCSCDYRYVECETID